MKELIKVNEKGLVSARELYLGLGLNKSQWSRWSKNNIEENEFFKENIDWVGFDMESSGNKLSDFAISLDFAKHIAMMAKTEESHKYRNYFIECEKHLKNNQLQLINSDLTKQINEIVQAKIDEIENKCSEYYRPSAFDKTNIAHYIKARLGITKANDEYHLVKERVLILLGAEKWEDIPIESLKSSLNLIDESIKIIKSDRPYQQTTMF